MSSLAPQILKKTSLLTLKWISVSQISWLDHEGFLFPSFSFPSFFSFSHHFFFPIFSKTTGKERIWEAVERTTKRNSNFADAVVIFSVIRRPKLPPSTLLALQFRPALGKTSVELPAGIFLIFFFLIFDYSFFLFFFFCSKQILLSTGLIDNGESVEEAALRELKEETGFRGVIRTVSPPIASDPGLTNSSFHHVVVDVDGTKEENRNPVQELDEGENVSVKEVEIGSLLSVLKELDKGGVVVDARLWSLAEGLSLREGPLSNL